MKLFQFQPTQTRRCQNQTSKRKRDVFLAFTKRALTRQQTGVHSLLKPSNKTRLKCETVGLLLKKVNPRASSDIATTETVCRFFSNTRKKNCGNYFSTGPFYWHSALSRCTWYYFDGNITNLLFQFDTYSLML